MEHYSLNGSWNMTGPDGQIVQGQIPGSVYSFLLDAGRMKDPYYRDQEIDALNMMEQDYLFSNAFDLPEGFEGKRNQVLRFEGIDTLSEVCLNGRLLGRTDNMHCAWEYPVHGLLKRTGNLLEVKTQSPTRFIREADRQHHLGGSYEAMRGFPHLRKAHCMFGWDWGPRLPDQGIWKDVNLIGWDEVRIDQVKVSQEHQTYDGIPVEEAHDGGEAARSGKVRVFLTVEVVLAKEDPSESVRQEGSTVSAGQECSSISVSNEFCPMQILLTSPSGQTYHLGNGEVFEVPDPQLWWPNGLGDQPLYTLTVMAGQDADADEKMMRIGLRSACIDRQPDEWGERFAAMVNGRTFFSMGADYIPEDCILSRRSPERTRALLESGRRSHNNMIRVWGGGFYPDDWFYDICDELGLFVWQDMMFACANYRLTPEFVKSITEEITQNVRRLRHHASLLLWCGNNEMEQFALEGEYEGTDETRADYLIQNETIIPEILQKEDPDRFYWPSSPSSGGAYDNPNDPDRGDVHYWSVWHKDEPFTAYRDWHFRFLSEFGFQSFPAMETIRSFTCPEDRNIFSYVMDMHQRNAGANGRILRYLSQNYLYPQDFETLVYASQLLQADAIRYGVEHLRRYRAKDRCMGAVYWQLNDIWPGVSWASMDYFQNWKALQYSARRFFAPVLVSCEEESWQSQGLTCISEPGERHYSARFNVSNETWETVRGHVLWQIRTPEGAVVREGEFDACTGPFDTEWFPQIDLDWIDPRRHHLYYELELPDNDGGMQSCSGDSVLFVPPKHYCFKDPNLTLHIDPSRDEITVEADAYAKAVEIYSKEGALLLSDNFFDMEPGKKTVRVLRGCTEKLRVRSVFNIGSELGKDIHDNHDKTQK